MKISDCKHQVEFNILGFVGLKGRDFTSWSKLLWVQINHLSSKIMEDSRLRSPSPNRLVMKTEVRNLLLIPISQLYPHFNLDEGKVGRWEIIIDDDCEDNTIFVTSNEDGEMAKFMPVINEPKNETSYKEISFLPKTHFSKEEVDEYEKKTRGCITLKNNLFNE